MNFGVLSRSTRQFSAIWQKFGPRLFSSEQKVTVKAGGLRNLSAVDQREVKLISKIIASQNDNNAFTFVRRWLYKMPTKRAASFMKDTNWVTLCLLRLNNGDERAVHLTLLSEQWEKKEAQRLRKKFAEQLEKLAHLVTSLNLKHGFNVLASSPNSPLYSDPLLTPYSLFQARGLSRRILGKTSVLTNWIDLNCSFVDLLHSCQLRDIQ